ncbi:putative acetyltransferase/hydrolase with alpha/beta hydrolase fold [Saccharomonospora marina XMU15]|uniref:Putative acetyltransferase/hydrolase with alpha/beta hydrolase fold n=1 Tax=Saccharomonospora marina XMU15 TaxID=882083 RepID=H5X1A4_9PSEU|nr:alpha/beta fold hydrolase [Saccharomonospora marina]EHR48628.1 putative acetyltransferase/hydrolase with alpha/beta hydrolase fold [Saccharomonospora marina XMU15]
MRSFAAAVAVLVAVVALPGTASAEEQKLPVPWSLLAGVTAQLAHPDSPPPGANDWSCEPSAEHPNPVVLVHGLIANQTVNWQTFSPLLANEGYCVYSFTYGVNSLGGALPGYQPGGMTRMEDSAEELKAFVEQVLASTGAAKVDLLGHSQGTIMPSYYVRFLDGESKVDKYVSLTPIWEGTTLAGLPLIYQTAQALGLNPVIDAVAGVVCASCPQFFQGSDYYKKLHAIGTFAPEVTYTNIVTRYDELVVPYTSGIAEAPNVTNHVLQDYCPSDFAEHGGVMADPVAAGLVLNALDPDNPRDVPCTVVTPLGAQPPPGW